MYTHVDATVRVYTAPETKSYRERNHQRQRKAARRRKSRSAFPQFIKVSLASKRGGRREREMYITSRRRMKGDIVATLLVTRPLLSPRLQQANLCTILRHLNDTTRHDKKMPRRTKGFLPELYECEWTEISTFDTIVWVRHVFHSYLWDLSHLCFFSCFFFVLLFTIHSFCVCIHSRAGEKEEGISIRFLVGVCSRAM